MQDLIERITSNVGIDENLANKSVGMILGYIQRMGEDGPVAGIIDNIPGAADMIAEFGDVDTSAETATGGGLMGTVMGFVSKFTGSTDGIMAIGQNLMSEGMDMTQVKSVASETVSYAKEQVGDDVVDGVLRKIPGLSSFL